MKRSAFTLMELLVVVSIIAILAAILFPVFARARENARRSACQSNLKQIGLGMLQYAQDYDERLPQSQRGFATNPGWRGFIEPYVKSIQVYDCPSNTVTGFADDAGYPVSYSVNGDDHRIGGRDPMHFDGRSVLLSQIVTPSQLLLVADSNTRGNYIYTDYVASMESGVQLRPLHFGRMNVLFADGHVKALKPTATCAGANMWTIADDAACPSDPANHQILDMMQALEAAFPS